MGKLLMRFYSSLLDVNVMATVDRFNTALAKPRIVLIKQEGETPVFTSLGCALAMHWLIH